MSSIDVDMAKALREREALKQRSLWLDAFELLIKNRLAMLGLVIAILFVLVAIFGPLLSPYSYTATDLRNISQPPSLQHPFGTDQLGRDFMTRIMYAARTALLVALIVTGVSTTIGITLGSLAAYLGGLTDTLISRLIDILMALPGILLAVFIDATIKPPVANAIEGLYQSTGWGILKSTLIADYAVVFVALGAISWAGTARLIRGQIISLREKDFIMAERALGARPRTILINHLIPNALGPVIVAASLAFGSAILLEATLSYLGIGIQPPGASLGAMINENLGQWRYKPHLVVVPSIALAVIMYAFSCLGDGINDALNPRLRRQ
jgi:ABC-type dipeptide/oligopeptide/nickel transport system permease subunit